MLLTEKNIHTEAYSHNVLGYGVTGAAPRPSSTGVAQGGVGLVMGGQPNEWGVKSTRFHGPNVMSCDIVNGNT